MRKPMNSKGQLGLPLIAILILVIVGLVAVLVSIFSDSFRNIAIATVLFGAGIFIISSVKNPKFKAIFGILLIGSALVFLFMNGFLQTSLDSGNNNVITLHKEKLTFCSTIDECKNVMISQGMPESYLEQNNIKIECQNGECYATK